MTRSVATLAVLAVACGGAPQLRIANYEDPHTASNPAGAAHVHYDDTMELEADAELVEPEHPFVKTAQERAMVHVHSPSGVCSGAIVAPSLVLTAHQCVGKDARGVVAIADKEAWRVEIPSSTLTWTTRKVTQIVTGDCDWAKLDVAFLVLDEPVTKVTTPVDIATTPAPGGPVQALGFGRCRGETRGFSERTGQVVERQSDAVVFDVGMCKGDVGGVVFDGSAAFGVVSHQDDPNGAARRTTTAFRLDTSVARHLLDAANAAATGGKPAVVACQ